MAPPKGEALCWPGARRSGLLWSEEQLEGSPASSAHDVAQLSFRCCPAAQTWDGIPSLSAESSDTSRPGERQLPSLGGGPWHGCGSTKA